MKTRTLKGSYKKKRSKKNMETKKGLEKLKCVCVCVCVCVCFNGRRSRRATTVRERRN